MVSTWLCATVWVSIEICGSSWAYLTDHLSSFRAVNLKSGKGRVCVFAGTCMNAYMWARKPEFDICCPHFCSYILRQTLSLTLVLRFIKTGRPAISRDCPVSFSSSLLELQVYDATPRFLCRFWDPEIRSSWMYRKHFTHWAISLAIKAGEQLSCVLFSSHYLLYILKIDASC